MKKEWLFGITLSVLLANVSFGADHKLSIKADFGMYRYGSWNLLWSFVKRPEFDKPHVRL